MKSRSEQLQHILETAFHPLRLSVEDESWKHAGHSGAKEQGGSHFRVEIVSDCFTGKSRIERHRIINETLAPLFGPTIHALQISTIAPSERKRSNCHPTLPANTLKP